MARLIMESGGERRELKVAGPITVGRSQTATVYLDDKTLSREHTQFYVDGGRLCVRDLESKNGTYLNGSLVKQAEALKHGDRVRVGTATFTVVLEAGDSMPAVALAPPPRQAAAATKPAPVAAPPPPRTRPSGEREIIVGGTPIVMTLFYRIILIGVVLVGAFLSKGLFHALLPRIPS